MSTDNIVFQDDDSEKETAIKTVQIWAGTSELGKHLKRLKIEYTKVNKGVYVQYVLKGAKIGRLVVRL
jgi:hypothetical protein